MDRRSLAGIVCRVEAEHGDPLAALDYVTLTIRTFHDAGNTTLMRSPMASLADLLDRLGRYEPAATIAGFAFSSMTATLPEFSAAIAHLREVLGDPAYESLRRTPVKTVAAPAIAANNLPGIPTRANQNSFERRCFLGGSVKVGNRDPDVTYTNQPRTINIARPVPGQSK